MKKIISCIALSTCFLLMAGTSIAQDGSDLKIAILDMATALLNSEMAKEVDEALQQETAEDQAKVRNLAEQAQELQETLQQDAEVMSESEQRRIVGELQELQNQYEFLVEKIQTLIQGRRQQFQQTYAPNLVQAISDVVEEEGFDLVFRSEMTLFYENTYDITPRVTEKLNQQ